MNLHAKCEKIRAVILDVDGVLTDGRIGYGAGSDEEIKFFHVRDGLGIALARKCGLKVGILSGRKSRANQRRAEELKLDFIEEGCRNKDEGLTSLLKKLSLTEEECMYIGDDLIDAAPLKRCAFGFVVADGAEELDRIADYRTKAKGGQGAIREAIEILLKEQGKWEKILEEFL
jgi:3-deoxy-D-manno-octulosonate 8-phosphate phosphatase (KDO 8-P phosphatase)